MKNLKKAKKWIIALAVLLLVIFLGVKIRNILLIRKSEIPADAGKTEKKTSLGTIDKSEGKVKVAESETKELYINTQNMNLYVKEKGKNTTWNAICESEKRGTELSLLTISYLGEDNSLTEWDSYTYCVEKDSYSFEQIENGIRILMNFNAGEASNFYEYMPPKTSEERYETVFLNGLKALVENGELEEAQYQRYLNTLGLVYSKSTTEAAYTVNYVGQPPESAVTQLIEVSKLVGYTTDMLLEDADTYGFTVEFSEPAEFNLALEAYLENDELVVNVPGDQIESLNDYYIVQNIKLLPNFSLVRSQDVTEGYFLLPDGAGALMKMNAYQAKIPEYSRSVYESDFFKEYYYISEYGEDLMMPVFGLMLNEGAKGPYAFLAIIESGTENAYITARLGSADETDVGVVYNKIFASFDTVQYDNVKVFGEYSSNGTSYMVRTNLMDIDYSIRYLLYPEETNYFTMAKDYQSYLLKNNNGHEMVYQTEAELYLNVLGAVTLTNRILGIPYNYEASLTSYEQAKEIMESLGDRNVTLGYEGAFSGGLENELLNSADFAGVNGSKKQWQALKDYIAGKGGKIYLSAPFLKIYNNGNGYVTKLHALSDYSSDPVHVYGYDLETAIFVSYTGTSNYHMLKPVYLKSVVNRFIKSDKEQNNLCLTDLASQYYADYKNGSMVMPHEAQRAADEAVSLLAQNRSLAMTNPRADKVVNADIAVDISRESSNYATFYATIPFRQLVLNGICKYTTSNINNNSKAAKYYLLQALETGSMLKYTVMAESSDLLKNSDYTYYFDVEYGKMEQEIKALYDEYQTAMQIIQNTEITNHEILGDNVFLTEYANGTKVITNYNAITVSVEENEIEGYSYKIIGKGE